MTSDSNKQTSPARRAVFPGAAGAAAVLALMALVWAGSAFFLPAAQKEFTFAVISDFRHHYAPLTRAMSFIDQRGADLVVVGGDQDPIERNYRDVFVPFGFGLDPDRPPNRQRLYFVIGNHDSPPLGEPFFREKLASSYPDNGPPGAPPGTVYSFDRGLVHFVITNQYWGDPEGGYTREQLTWLSRDLAASRRPYKFVFGHEPAFPARRHVGDSLDQDPARRDEFWDILVENGVGAYFCGHTHYYNITRRRGVHQIDSGVVAAYRITVLLLAPGPEECRISFFETKGPKPTAIDEIEHLVIPPNPS